MVTASHADFDGCDLNGARLIKIDLSNATLVGANLEGADLTEAKLLNAQLSGVRGKAAKFVKAYLFKVNLNGADLSGADLLDSDLRDANMSGVRLDGSTLTGAKVAGLLAEVLSADRLVAGWLDTSAEGNGSRRLSTNIGSVFMRKGPIDPSLGAASRRYFGRGDVLRNATLEFGEGAEVQIDSVFEQCSIVLGRGTQLTIGKEGVLSDCQIMGEGDITVDGHFFERKSPGIVGAKQLIVTSAGTLVSTIQQASEPTRFAFERGCRLRMKVIREITSTSGA